MNLIIRGSGHCVYPHLLLRVLLLLLCLLWVQCGYLRRFVTVERSLVLVGVVRAGAEYSIKWIFGRCHLVIWRRKGATLLGLEGSPAGIWSYHCKHISIKSRWRGKVVLKASSQDGALIILREDCASLILWCKTRRVSSCESKGPHQLGSRTREPKDLLCISTIESCCSLIEILSLSVASQLCSLWLRLYLMVTFLSVK